MSGSTLYRAYTDTVLLAARRAALDAAGAAAASTRIAQVYELAERAAALERTPTADGEQDARTLLAGIVVAHALPGAVRASDGDVADQIVDELAALRGRHDARLRSARAVAALAATVELERSIPVNLIDAVRDLATLLRTTGTEHVAAGGHLARRFSTDPTPYQPHLADAWYAACGSHLLVPRDVRRATAVGMVAAGVSKTDVARLSDVSRTTLDSWLITTSPTTSSL